MTLRADRGFPSLDSQGQVNPGSVAALDEGALAGWIEAVIRGQDAAVGSGRDVLPSTFLRSLTLQVNLTTCEMIKRVLIGLLSGMVSQTIRPDEPSKTASVSDAAVQYADDLLLAIPAIFTDANRNPVLVDWLLRIVMDEELTNGPLRQVHLRAITVLLTLDYPLLPSFLTGLYKRGGAPYAGVVWRGLCQYNLENAFDWLKSSSDNDKLIPIVVRSGPCLVERFGPSPVSTHLAEVQAYWGPDGAAMIAELRRFLELDSNSPNQALLSFLPESLVDSMLEARGRGNMTSRGPESRQALFHELDSIAREQAHYHLLSEPWRLMRAACEAVKRSPADYDQLVRKSLVASIESAFAAMKVPEEIDFEMKAYWAALKMARRDIQAELRKATRRAVALKE